MAVSSNCCGHAATRGSAIDIARLTIRIESHTTSPADDLTSSVASTFCNLYVLHVNRCKLHDSLSGLQHAHFSPLRRRRRRAVDV